LQGNRASFQASGGSSEVFRTSLQATGGNAAEHLFKQQEEACKAREHIFNEWEHAQLNIREFCKALRSEMNEVLKRDMEADIVVLINRKNQLSAKLN